MPSLSQNPQPLRCHLHQLPDARNSNKTLQNRYTGADPYYLFASKPSPSSQTRLSCIRHLLPTPPSGIKPAICFDNARLAIPPMHYCSRGLQASPDTPQPHVAGSISSTISLARQVLITTVTYALEFGNLTHLNTGELKGQGRIGSSTFLLPIRVSPQANTSGPGLPPLLLDPEQMVPRPTMPHVSQPQPPSPR